MENPTEDEVTKPVTSGTSPEPAVRRTERGSLRGRVRLAPDFDDLPDELTGRFGNDDASAAPSPETHVVRE